MLSTNKRLIISLVIILSFNVIFYVSLTHKLNTIENNELELKEAIESSQMLLNDMASNEFDPSYYETNDVIAKDFVSTSTENEKHKVGASLVKDINQALCDYLGTNVDFKYEYYGLHGNTFTYHITGSDTVIDYSDGHITKLINTFDRDCPHLVHDGFGIPKMQELYEKVKDSFDKDTIYSIIPNEADENSYELENVKTKEKVKVTL